MFWLLPLLQPIAAAGVPIVGDIVLKWLRRYADNLQYKEPAIAQEIHDTVASGDTERISQLIHRLREARKRSPAK